MSSAITFKNLGLGRDRPGRPMIILARLVRKERDVCLCACYMLVHCAQFSSNRVMFSSGRFDVKVSGTHQCPEVKTMSGNARNRTPFSTMDAQLLAGPSVGPFLCGGVMT